MYILEFRNLTANEEVDHAIDEHRAYLAKYIAEGVFLVAGAKVPRTGGIVIANGIDRARLDGIIAEAPFVKAGTATVSVTEFSAKHMAEALRGVVR